VNAEKSGPIARFILFSALGAISFFVPISIGDRSTIVIDHLVTLITDKAPIFANSYAVLLILWGVVAPFWTKNWLTSKTTAVLSCLQILSVPLAFMYLSGHGPAAIMAPDMLPFLFEKLAVPVGLIVPIGAIFLTFLIGFGLLEAIGIFMEPVMRPLFRTPGRSAIDAVASFAGSYSVGLLITSRVYKTGMYSAKEAAIIATGFSTVSATFMVVVAKTLALSEMWNVYFFGTLFVTFMVTAITVRLPPLSTFDNYSAADDENPSQGKSFFVAAWKAGIQAAQCAPSIGVLLKENVIDGLKMASRVVPSILSVGLLGLLAAKYTPLFHIIGWLLTPVVWLVHPDDANGVSSIIASGLAEMFLPAVQAVALDTGIRFVIGVVSVSSILFLSASIPCILATGIPISLAQMLFIWLQRTLLSIPLAWGVWRFFGLN
jgi:nucleoside recognition membrane protein YjiH